MECKIEVESKDGSVQCDLCDKYWYVDISSAEYKKLNLVHDHGIVQYAQKKCHFRAYLIQNSIYSYPETLIIIVLKPYPQRKLINLQKWS